MTKTITRRLAQIALLSVSPIALTMTAAPAVAQTQIRSFDIPAQPLSAAILEFSRQADVVVVVPPALAAGKRSAAIKGSLAVNVAIAQLLKPTGLRAIPNEAGGYRVGPFAKPTPHLAETPTRADDSMDIVVTAQKRSQKLLSVPAAVTALQNADLLRQQSDRIADYAQHVPGMSLIAGRVGQTQVILRGISTGFNGSGTTAIYVDDSPYGSSTSFAIGGFTALDLDPASIERVEVLRGPQGTLYGASSLGGLVKYVTAPPSLTNFGGRIEVGASAIDGGQTGYDARVSASGPLVQDKLGLSVTGFYRHDPGYIDNSFLGRSNVNDARVYGGRAALFWQASDALTVQLAAMVHSSRTDASSEVDLTANLKPAGGKLNQVRFIKEPFNTTSQLYSGTINYDFGWSKLTSITSYQHQSVTYDQDYSVAYGPLLAGVVGVADPGMIARQFVHQKKVTQELRLASTSAGPLEWQGGFFFTHENSQFPQSLRAFDKATGNEIPLAVKLFDVNLMSKYTEYAGFGDLTYHFSPKFNVLAGIRYSHNHQNFRDPSDGVAVGGPSLIVGKSSDHSFTYLVSPRFNFDEDNMIFARIASGYRPGGPNSVTPAQVAVGVPATFKPDTLTSYEAGYKASLFDHHATIELSAFDIEWKNIQLLETFQNVGTIGNGTKARSSGLEAAVTVKPATGLKLSGNFTYTDAHLTADDPTISARSGDRLPETPKYAATLSGDYDFALSSQATGFVGATFHYQGSRASEFVTFSPAGYQRPTLPSYQTVDVRAGVELGQLTIEIYGKNLNNSHGLYRLRSLAIDGFSAPLTASIIEPRRFGISASQKF